MAITEKMRAYAVNKAAGLKNKEAAIAAGFSPKTADIQAARLNGHPEVKKAIAAAKRDMRKGVIDKPDVPEADLSDEAAHRNKMPKAKYTDALEFLVDAMNHKHLPIAARADYAKALLPYQHARIAEKGKKETKKDRAQQIAGGAAGKGSKPKFATKSPPPLKVVGGTG
jgi:Phage terminase, small subunit